MSELPNTEPNCKRLGSLFKPIILRAIYAAPSKAEMKERIMIARLDGHIGFDEAEAMIRDNGLVHA